jgi:hypothetical protein
MAERAALTEKLNSFTPELGGDVPRADQPARQEDSLARIHRTYREWCESKGWRQKEGTHGR